MNKDRSFPPLILPDKFFITQMEKGFQPQSTRDWSRKIKSIYGNQCVITGVSTKEGKIVAHHLNSKKEFPQLTFSVLNGLPLLDVVHKNLHKKCGFNTNLGQFKDYLGVVFKNNPQFDPQRLILLSDWVSFLEIEIEKKYSD